MQLFPLREPNAPFVAPVRNAADFYMALTPVNFDELHASLPRTPIYLNDMDSTTAEGRAHLTEKIMTTYSHTDVLSPAPTCACPDGGVNYGFMVGTVCPDCNTVVEKRSKEAVQPAAWFRRPDGIDKLISPLAWEMMRKTMTFSKVSLLNWLCDPTTADPISQWGERPSSTCLGALKKLQSLNLERGFNSIYRNWPTIKDLLLKLTTGSQKRAELQEFFDTHEDKIFCDYIPFPTSIMSVLVDTSVGKYGDHAMASMLNAARTAPTLKRNRRASDTLSHRITDVMNGLADYYDKQFSDAFKKPGIARKNGFGTRVAFSERSVITGLSGPHDHRKLITPYTQTVVALNDFLYRVLIKKYGMTGKEADNYIKRHTKKIDPFLKDVLEKDVLQQFNDGRGMSFFWIRYPTLKYGSIQHFYVAEVGETSALSVLVVGEYNADFDGDQMSGAFGVLPEVSAILRRQAQHMLIHDAQRPYQLNGSVKLPDLTSEILFHAMEREDYPDIYAQAKRPIDYIDVPERGSLL